MCSSAIQIFCAHEVEFFVGYSTVFLGVIAPFAFVQAEFWLDPLLVRSCLSDLWRPRDTRWELVAESGTGRIITVV